MRREICSLCLGTRGEVKKVLPDQRVLLGNLNGRFAHDWPTWLLFGFARSKTPPNLFDEIFRISRFFVFCFFFFLKFLQNPEEDWIPSLNDWHCRGGERRDTHAKHWLAGGKAMPCQPLCLDAQADFVRLG